MKETYPKIMIQSGSELEKLLQWRDKNKDLVRQFHTPLDKGIIEYANAAQIYFKLEGLTVNYKFFYLIRQEKHLIADIDLGVLSRMVHVNEYNGKAEDQEGTFQDIITVHASLMAYMVHYKDVKQRVQKSTIVSTQGASKKKKQGNKKKNLRTIGTTVYRISIPNENKETRQYERHTEGWFVRGFWRTYKDGRRVWIDPHIRGNKQKAEQAIYKM